MMRRIALAKSALAPSFVAGVVLCIVGAAHSDQTTAPPVRSFEAVLAAHICQARPALLQSTRSEAVAATWAEHDAAHSMPASPEGVTATQPAGPRKVLHYRNPMGLSDTSPVPKKDSMGMDYIAVYERETSESGTVHLTPERIQRSGVTTEVVEARVLAQPVRGFGTVKYDERRITAVSVGVEGLVEDLYVRHVGQTVRAGEPLFKMSSNNAQMLQIEIARRSRTNGRTESTIPGLLTGASSSGAVDWPSPATGLVIDKRIVTGQRIGMGEEVMRLADVSRMWVVADIAEIELPAVKPGQRATVTPRAYPGQPIEGTVLFIYPELRVETRTARIAIEVSNPDGRLKAEMYADVVLQTGADRERVVAVPSSAIIEDGIASRVLVATGDGDFEPRSVKLGLRGADFAEVLSGVGEGETVVTSAAFLIDSESNINAALAAITKSGAPR